MQLFLRWSTAHIRMQKRMQRFIARVQVLKYPEGLKYLTFGIKISSELNKQWLVYTQSYELLRRSKAILGTKISNFRY